MVLAHAKEGTGCVDCHGQSYAHRNDEDNITPPDTMFAHEDIAKNCAECHDTHDAPAKKVLARWQERCPAVTNPEELVCTDCHGSHRLDFRTVWWNKKTRELIVRGDQRVKFARDLTKVEESKKAEEPKTPEKPEPEATAPKPRRSD
jgi:predicted CXXCH cytochrome family protein